MNLTFDLKLAKNYKSPSQKMRILTEHWVGEEIFCPSCGYSNIDRYPNNQPVADFFCPSCKEDYELKSKKDNIGGKILDGAYKTKMERLRSSNNPNLFVLNYSSQNLSTINFFAIPKYFFVPAIIEKRKPLAVHARRAGWIGSNILLQRIPQAGKIFFVKDKVIESKNKVLDEWKKTLFLREEKDLNAKGWLLDVMSCVEDLGKKDFYLDEVYAFEGKLKAIHPNNNFIKDKIRQQLQFLRDKGYLSFVEKGKYKIN